MTDLALLNANVLDVESGAIIGERTVHITDGLIEEISANGGENAERSIDLKGLTLMPGLCDGHVHVTAATANFPLLMSWSPAYVTARAGDILHGMLMRGFTTVRDAGGADHGLVQAVEEGYLTGPRILFLRDMRWDISVHFLLWQYMPLALQHLQPSGRWNRSFLPRVYYI